MIYHREFRLSIKWLKRALSKEIPCLNKFYKIYSNTPFIFPLPKKLTLFEGLEIKLTFCLPCKGRWVQLVALGWIIKNSLDIESKLFLALSVFCSGAVPLYSSHSQNTKFISLSQSLPACRNL